MAPLKFRCVRLWRFRQWQRFCFHKNILIFQRVFTAIFVCENFIMTLAILCEVLDIVLIKMHYEYHEYVGIGLAVFLVSWYLAIVAYILRRFLSIT